MSWKHSEPADADLSEALEVLEAFKKPNNIIATAVCATKEYKNRLESDNKSINNSNVAVNFDTNANTENATSSANREPKSPQLEKKCATDRQSQVVFIKANVLSSRAVDDDDQKVCIVLFFF